MRRSLIGVGLIALALAGFAAGCDGEDGDGRPDETTTETETQTEPANAYDTYYQEQLPAAPTDAPPPTLPDPARQALIDDLVATAQVNQDAAAALSQATGRQIAPADTANVEDVACQQGGVTGANQLASIAPGADLAVLPNVNDMTGVIAKICGQVEADAFSAQALSYLLSNTQAAPPTVSTPSTDVSLLNRAACRGLKSGLANRINKWLRIRGAGRFGVSLAVGAALTDCPETLDAILANE